MQGFRTSLSRGSRWGRRNIPLSASVHLVEGHGTALLRFRRRVSLRVRIRCPFSRPVFCSRKRSELRIGARKRGFLVWLQIESANKCLVLGKYCLDEYVCKFNDWD